MLLHVWMVDPQRADRHIQLLTELFEQVAGRPGFVAARILTSPERSSIAAMVAMRTEEEREQLERHPAVQDVLHQLSGSASLVERLYEVTAAFTAPREEIR